MHRDRVNNLVALFCLSIGIVLIAILLTSCRGTVPAVEAKFWAGDSVRGGITRAQESKTMMCTDSEFDDYVCLTYEDLKEIYALLLQCKSWSTAELAKNKHFQKFYRKNRQVVDYVNALYTYEKSRK